MSEKQRYRSGPQKIVTGKIKAGTKAEIGNLMFRSSDEYLYPASTIAVDGSGSGSGGGFTGGNALTDFKGACAGVLVEGATSGLETADSDCSVGYGATYEFNLSVAADANYPPGYPVTAFTVSGHLSNDTVALNASRTNAIALIARELLQGATTVFIDVRSSIMEQPVS